MKSPPCIARGSFPYAPSTGQGVARPDHRNEADREPWDRFGPGQPAEILAEERHAEHAVRDDAFEPDRSRSLIVSMNEVVVARGAGIFDQLQLGDLLLSKFRQDRAAVEVLVRPRGEHRTGHRRMAVVVPLKIGFPEWSAPSLTTVREGVSASPPSRR